MKKVGHLVVDSVAFIRNASLYDYAEDCYTVSGAIKEIKDKATLQRLQVLPFNLHIKEPSADALKYVSDFSKKTGDYSSLSKIDLQLLALTYQLEKEHVGTDHLNKEPICRVTGKPAIVDNQLEGFYYPKKKGGESEDEASGSEAEDEEEMHTDKEEINIKNCKNDTFTYEVENDEKIFSSNHTESDDESDEESWITPNNIAEVQKRMGELTLDQNSSLSVACITSDFSMQNVLLQMGLHVISVDGMLIKEARVFILRCFACFKTTNDTSKMFCPNCGNKTLKRVAVTVNEDGTKNIHINFRKRISTRGTRYSLPAPKGGKHAVNPILCEDQPIPQNRPSKSMTKKTDALSPDYEVWSSPFAVNDVYSRAASLGIRSNKSKSQRRNPNEWSKRTGNKKRR